MPGQGIASTFAFGKIFGALLGVLVARSVPLTLVAEAALLALYGVRQLGYSIPRHDSNDFSMPARVRTPATALAMSS
jgi:hypothetical protein